MPLPPGKTQLNLTVTDEEKQRIAELASHYEDSDRGWYAVVLLRFGIRHAKQAWKEMKERAEGRFRDEDDLNT